MFNLQEVTKIGEGFLNKPEDLCFDEEGTLYTATRDGWIKRMHRNGSVFTSVSNQTTKAN